ncbi:hypothetical protein KEM52_005268 [Ascosphaera acerosa]|nr:hypothetical protein KEM52_005268 [Ascosphaera acerosa]
MTPIMLPTPIPMKASFSQRQLSIIASISHLNLLLVWLLYWRPPNSEDISSDALESLSPAYAQLRRSSHHASLVKSIIGLGASVTAVLLAAFHTLPMMRNDIQEKGVTELWTCASDSRGRNARGEEVSLPPELARLCGDAETAYILTYVILVLEALMLSTAVVGYARAIKAAKARTRTKRGTESPPVEAAAAPVMSSVGEH